MGNPHDSIALDWVRGEIQETLKQAQQALETSDGKPDDPARLRFCLTHLHQVHGALRMVELFGAAQLTEEMQAVTQALLTGTVAVPDDAVAILMQAMLQLPQYLEQLHSCRDDFPLVLLPLLNDLRTARAEPLLPESALFAPDLSPARFQARADAGQRLQAPSVLGHLQKLRQMFQFAVAGIRRGQELDAHFDYLDKVVMRLVKLCQQTPMGEIWLATGALIDSLKTRRNPVNAAILALLSELDLQLERLIHENIDVLQQPVPEVLLKDILYYVARAADTESPRIHEIAQRYQLASALPGEDTLTALRQRVGGPGQDTIHSVITALSEELALVKDQLDLFVRAEFRQNSDLSELLPGLQQIAGTLAVLGLTDPRTVIAGQIEIMNGLADSDRPIDDAVLMEIAGALLYVEATLNGIDRQPGRRCGQTQHSNDPTSNSTEFSLSGPHLTDATTALLREARNSLEPVKSAIVALVASHWDPREVAEVPELLHSIRGALKLILLDRAADMLASCEAFVREVVIGGEQGPEWQRLDILADVISGLEHYLERMAEGVPDSDAVLDTAERSLLLLDPRPDGSIAESCTESVEPAPEPEHDEDCSSSVVDEDILETFLEEAEEVLETIRRTYPRFRQDPEELDALRDVRRAFHTLKGSGRLVGAIAIGELGWAVENLLNHVLDHRTRPSHSMHQLLDEVVERLPGMLDDFRKGHPLSQAQELIERAEYLANARKPEIDDLPILTETPADALKRERTEDALSPAAEAPAATSAGHGESELTGDESRRPTQPRVEPEPADEVGAAAILVEDVDPDLLDIFRSETEAHLETLRQFLADARKQSSSAYTDAISRALHTLKGSANTAGIEPISKVIGPFENYVKTARAQDIRADSQVIALLQRLHDFVVDGLAQLEDSPQLALAGTEPFLGDLDELARATLPQTTGGDDSAVNRPDARLVRIFLSDGMDTLLDGDLILAEWSQSGQPSDRLPQLEHELQKLALDAAAADLGDVSEVADVLFLLCSSGHQSAENPGDEFFMQARAGHDHLIDLMDQVAAGLSTRPDAALVVQLRQQIERFAQSARSVRCDEFIADPDHTAYTPDRTHAGNLDRDLEHEPNSGENTPGSDIPEREPVCCQQNDAPSIESAEPFLAEAGNLIDHTGELLLHWKHQPDPSCQPEQDPLLHQLQRDLRSLMVGARMAGFAAIGDLSHELATLLEALAENILPASGGTGDIEDLLSRSHDRLAAMVDSVRTEGAAHPAPDLLGEIQHYVMAARPGLYPEVNERPEAASSARQETETPATANAPEDVPEEGSPDAELTDIFLEEASDIIQTSGELLLQWRNDTANADIIRTLQRELHTLKGGARMAQIGPTAEIAHEMEALFEAIAEGKLEATSACIDVALWGHDQLAASVESVAEQGACSGAAAALAELRTVLQDKAEANGKALDLGDCSGEQERTPDQGQPDPDNAPSGADENLDAELIGIFLEEAHELINSTASALYGWVENPDERALAQELQRDLHTLKGGARMAQVSAIGDLSHVLEDLFEAVVGGRLSFSPAMGDLLFQCHDALAGMVEQVAAGRPLQSPATLISQIEKTIQGVSIFAPSPAPSLESTAAQDLSRLFLDEARDIGSAIARRLEHWHGDEDGRPRVIADLQSDLHTLKGGARLADVDAVTELAAFWDERLQGLLIGDYENAATLALSERCLETLERLLDAMENGLRPTPLSARLAELIDSGPAAPEANNIVDAEVRKIFLDEADELLEALEQTLAAWHEDADDPHLNHEAQRVLHTLKGGARLVNATDLGNEVHRFESRLSEIQGSGEAPTETDWQAIDHCHGRLTELVEQVRQQYVPALQGSAMPDSPATPLLHTPQPEAQLTAEQETFTPEQAGQAQIQQQKAERRQASHARRKADAVRAAQDTIRVNAQLMDELVNLAGETSITRGRVEQQVNDFSHTLEDMVATIDRLREQLRRMEIETETQILFSAEKEFGSRYDDEFDPLEMDRYSSIQQLSRALGESASDLADLRETLAEKVRDAETLLLQQARVNTELQEGLMKTRMIPFASVVPRLRRIVRQIGGELGKKVEFDVRNAEGELDRTVLERMVAPLEHMLRNALDHGIETVEDRIKAGKSDIGQVKLSLAREGGEVVLRMTDDGAGIPTDKVREKAIRNGLLQVNEAIADRDILQFILQPGFSTAQSVTQISGRGVGMDVVASEIKQLGGSLDIESIVGQGTTFTVHLPFTVSVNRALMVSTGEDLYAIPLNTIDGIVRVSTYELEEYYKPGSPPYEYAGQQYRLQYLGTLLHSDHEPKLQGQALPLPVILVRGADQPMALQVDSLLGSREIVVKPLGPQFGSVRGVSGATITGDGNVVVILDLPAMIRADILSARQRQLAELAGEEESPRIDTRATTVMVVDDSVTVRKVTSRLLERHGIEVLLAKDGLDAVAQLQDHVPDVILLDIEMPRMDGFEVAGFIRYDSRLKHLPIIMITSRTGSKHRQRATALGVDEYLGKPFQEQELLETIERLRG